MHLIEIHFQNLPSELNDLFIAELSGLAYSSFWERDDGLCVYIELAAFEEQDLLQIIQKYQLEKQVTYQIQATHHQNWDKAQEDFAPILIKNQCLIYPPHSPVQEFYPYKIIIQPRLSFGTGQHPSTFLSIEMQLELDFHNKKVLDLGCGSGILAILAQKMGASQVDALDNNPWAIEICKENIQLNQCPQIQVWLGDIYSAPLEKSYDIILANINAEVLLQEIPNYVSWLKPNAYILLSGFLKKDEPAIQQLTHTFSLEKCLRKEKANWIAALYQSPKNLSFQSPNFIG